MVDGQSPAWFDLNEFAPGFRRESAGVYLLDEVGSTNDFLLGRGDPASGILLRRESGSWLRAAKGELAPPPAGNDMLCAAARVQTAGRGRRSRGWFSGGLQLSWRLPPPPPETAARLSVWTGLMVVRALAEICDAPVRMKWPNDLYLGGRKLGGLIHDLIGCGDSPILVGGLGLNLDPLSAGMPADVRGGAATLATAENPPSAAAAAGRFLSVLDAEVPRFIAEGWQSYRAEFDRIDHLAGKIVELEDGGRKVGGIAAGIDDDGALLLESTEGSVRRVLVGDVHILDFRERAADGGSGDEDQGEADADHRRG